MEGTTLDSEARRRYSRSLMLPGFTREAQVKIMGSKVAVIGAGALGTVCCMYLAASGVGRISVADFDTVDISNLQRQIAFEEGDVGKPKATALARKMKAINSGVEAEACSVFIKMDTVARFIEGASLVVEASDNPSTKRMVTEACAAAGIPYVLGGVSEWGGQATAWKPGYTPYSELFPLAPEEEGFTPCSLGGVLGPLPGIIGAIEAAEALKILSGCGTPLFGRLLTVDALTMKTQEFCY